MYGRERAAARAEMNPGQGVFAERVNTAVYHAGGGFVEGSLSFRTGPCLPTISTHEVRV